MKIITAKQAAELIKDGNTLAIGGFGSYCSPDELLAALADRYKQSGHPANITTVTGISPGDSSDNGTNGLDLLALEGLIECVITGHIAPCHLITNLTAENKLATYALPLGVVFHLMRSIASRKPGVLTTVGLKTYADPRLDGCRMNDRAISYGRKVVELINIDDKDYLFYPSFNIDAAFIRASYADEDGNISVENEGITGAEMEMAEAVHACGGKVIVQVEKIVPSGSIHPRKVRIHNSIVDYVVVNTDPSLHKQCYEYDQYHPEVAGNFKLPLDEIPPMEMSIRKLIARRAAMELKSGCIINLGVGMPSGVGSVANEEGIVSTLSLESGPVGGVPLEGLAFGASANPEMINTSCDTFDLYDGGWLDYAILGLAETDKNGNVNVSKFGKKQTGPGGLVNITQNTPNIFFIGSFTAGQSDIEITESGLKIKTDAPANKFVDKVQQVTFSADYARDTHQNVYYITERAVFKLVEGGIELIEIAPGVDLEKDVLAHMGFKPLISKDLKLMDIRLFKDGPMGIINDKK